MADYSKDVLVDTQWLEDHLGDDSLRVVEVDENPALYAEAHIPGAGGFDWKRDLEDQVKRAATAAFRTSFLVAAVLALLALVPALALRDRSR